MAVLIFPGADAVLAAQAAALPQPDQMCGPFAAHVGLHAVLHPADVPGMRAIAAVSGTRIWPHDQPSWRPSGAPLDAGSWEGLPHADSPEQSGSEAGGLARGIGEATHGLIVAVPVLGRTITVDGLGALLRGIAASVVPMGVVANLRTGVLDPDTGWDVGHFVVLWAIDPGASTGVRIAVADTYRELGVPGEPSGCRWVPLERLAAALEDPPGRGLLLAVRTDDVPMVTDMVVAADLDASLWST